MATENGIDDRQQRLDALTLENQRLREALSAQEKRGVSRRGLLAGGGAVLAASAGAGVFAPLRDLSAQSPSTGQVIPALGGSRLGPQFYLQITGSKQGVFAGDLDGDGVADKIAGLKYDHSVSQPRDPSSGQATGKRQYQPVRIVKEIDKASPMLFQALATNELLPAVLVSFLGKLAGGTYGVVYTVRLTNAFVSSFEQMIGNVSDEEESDPRVLEEVSFTFQKITLTWVNGGTAALDTLNNP